MNNFKELTKDRISQLPKNPGVYIFKDKGGIILYIGKSLNIKERVKNHFPSRSEGERRTNVLRTQQSSCRDNLFLNKVKKIGYVKTGSEIEALILEANLIKKYQPKYNVVWRDDKNYFFVGITKEEFPRVFITHQPEKVRSTKYEETKKHSKSSEFRLHPLFVGPFVEGNALKQTLKILRKVFPHRTCVRLPKRPCLWHQLNRCPGPCLLKSNLGKQIIQYKISNIQKQCQRNATGILRILQGGKTQVMKELKKEMKEASFSQDYERAAKIRDQISSLEKILANAKIFTNEIQERVNSAMANYYDIEKKLREILKIKREICRIEAYDVSNIQGKDATAAMVTFINGLPAKNFYRRFKIKIAGKPDDVAMIKEALSRRFNHPEWPFPDLILIDGGKAQLNAALQCLTFHVKQVNQCLTWNVKQVKQVKQVGVVALAKKKNELYIKGRGEPLLLKNLPREIFNLILQLRDEAHRFALAYHRKLRTEYLLKE